MYEELVKALLETRERVKSNPDVAMFVPPYQLSAAANAIEELERENDFLKSMQRSLAQGRNPEELAYMIHKNMR